jgi:hypothetical protein
VLAASDGRRSAAIARSFQDAGVRLSVIDGRELAVIPWPEPASIFAFTDTGLTATLPNRAVTLPYDSSGVGVYCSPPSDLRRERLLTQPPAREKDRLAKLGLQGQAVVEAIEWTGNLDLYFQRGAELDRISIVEDLTDFSGLGPLQPPTAAESMEATLAECKSRFPHFQFDTRLRNIRPRRRFVPDDSEPNPETRRRYSFGTSLLREVLGSISPELSELTQYELASRLGYIMSRGRTPGEKS